MPQNWEDAEDLEARVLRGLRNPDEILFGTEDVVDALVSAVDTLDRLVPMTRLSALQLSEGKSVYQIPEFIDLDSGDLQDSETGDRVRTILGIRNFYGASQRYNSLEELVSSDLVVSPTGLSGISVDENHSLIILKNINDRFWESRTEFISRFEETTRELTISPTPHRSTVAILELKIQRKLEDVPEKYKEALAHLAIAEAADILSVNYAVVQNSPTPVGDISYNTDGLRKLAKKRKEQALAKLGIGGGDIIIG